MKTILILSVAAILFSAMNKISKEEPELTPHVNQVPSGSKKFSIDEAIVSSEFKIDLLIKLKTYYHEKA